MPLVIEPVFDSLILVALFCLVWGGMLLIRPRGATLSRGKRHALLACRAGTGLLLVFLLLRPHWVQKVIERQAATVIFLIDQSRSMSVADEVSGQSRFARLREVLQAYQAELAELSDSLQVKFYGFDDSLYPLDWNRTGLQLPQDCLGRQTAFGVALEELTRLEAGQRVLAVVLLTDGKQTALPPKNVPPQIPAEQLARWGTACFAVPFGQPRGLGQFMDLGFADVHIPDRGFVKNQLEISGSFRAEGLAGKKVLLRLLAEDSAGTLSPVDEQSFSIAGSTEQRAFRCRYSLPAPGEIKVVVELVPQPGELTTENNRRSGFIRVLKGGVNVLFLEGFPPRPEQALIRRALGSFEQVNLDVVILDPRRPETFPADLNERLRPGRYEVFILGNVPASALKTQLLQALADAVHQGAGLVMLGGTWSFGPGGYADTPIADVLPVRMSHLEIQRIDEPVRTDVHLPGPIRCRLTKLGREQPWLALAEGESGSESGLQNDTLWEKLPPLPGMNRFMALKRTAQVLIETPDAQPVLVYHPVGDGRAVALAIDCTWYWALAGFREPVNRFWRQMTLWLARKDLVTDGLIAVELSQRRFEPGQRVVYRVRENRKGLEGDEELVATLFSAGGVQTPLPPPGGPPNREGSFSAPEQPGEYTLRIDLQGKTGQVASAEARFSVLVRDLELEDPAADLGTLEQLAKTTGGRVIPPDQFGELLKSLRQTSQTLETTIEVRQSLWDRWPILMLLVACLCVEWYFRRRWGMV